MEAPEVKNSGKLLHFARGNEILIFDGVLDGIDAHVVYKKKQIKGGRFLYAFKDARKARLSEYIVRQIGKLIINQYYARRPQDSELSCGLFCDTLLKIAYERILQIWEKQR